MANSSKIVHMPDIEYIKWLNDNRDLLSEISKTGKIPTTWLNKGSNKKFLVRYYQECGYTITIK